MSTSSRDSFWQKAGFWWLLAGVVGLLLRWLHLYLLVEADPFLVYPIIDAEGYHEWALRIMNDPLGDQVFFQSPGYPYVVALLYKIAGISWIRVAVVQGLAGAVSALLAGAIARRTMQPIYPRLAPWAGVITAWLLALYKPLVYYDALLLKVEFTNLFFFLAVWLLYRSLDAGRSVWFWLLVTGVVSGVGVLFRGNLLLIIPLWALWLLLAPRWTEGISSKAAWRKGLGQSLFYVLGVTLVLQLTAARNYIVAGQWVSANAAGGVVAYVGNNPYSPRGDYIRLPFLRAHPRFERIDFLREAERRAGRRMTVSEANRFWWKEAIRYSLSHPWQTLRRLLHKTTLAAESYEMGDNYSLYFHSRYSWALSLAFVSWSLLLALAFPVLLDLRNLGARTMPLWLFVLGYLATLLLFFVRSRYRLPIVVATAPLAGIGAMLFWHEWRQQHKRRLLSSLLVFLAVFAFSVGVGLHREMGEGHGEWLGRLAMLKIEHNQPREGRRLLQQALREDPHNATLWLNRGTIELGVNPKLALRYCQRAHTLAPKVATIRDCLAFAWLQNGNPWKAQRALQPTVSPFMPPERSLLFALILYCQGRWKAAVAQAQRTLQLHPGYPRAHAMLANFYRSTSPQHAAFHRKAALRQSNDPKQRAEMQGLIRTRFPVYKR